MHPPQIHTFEADKLSQSWPNAIQIDAPAHQRVTDSHALGALTCLNLARTG